MRGENMTPILPPKATAQKRMRMKGLLKVVLGTAGFAIGLGIVHYILPHFKLQPTPVGLVPLALPGAYALAGLMELITGLSFLEMAMRWDQLKGWQRGVLGTLVVLVSGALILWIFALVMAE